MARTVLLSSLRTWARRLSDTENDPNVVDAELTDLANRHLTEVWDLLVAAGPPEYYAATATIGPTTPGNEAYALPADFRTLLDVYAQETTDIRRPVLPMGDGQRGRYKPPTGVWSFSIEYIPAPPILSDGGVNTFDGISGWEELIACLMARDVMIKREADPSAVIASVSRLTARINGNSSRNRGMPKRITDLDAIMDADWPWGWTSNVRVAAYRLRGSNIEFWEPISGLP